MLDTTTYADKFSPQLNELLNSFTGSECIMVRKPKEKDNSKGRPGNCHLNVKSYIDKFGGKSISGWLLNRIPSFIAKGMYVWSFHSVWLKPDGKLLDVTDDKHYIGRDKSIFIPDTLKSPDLVEGTSYNNFLVFTERAFAEHYGRSIGSEINSYTLYWCDTTMIRLIGINEHSGVYRLLSKDYPNNLKKMCNEYELEVVNGKPLPKAGSKYEEIGALPPTLVFDYSVSSRG